MMNKMILQIRGDMLCKIRGTDDKYCILSSYESDMALFKSKSKYETKMWMDLNGLKLGNNIGRGKNFVWRQYELLENDT